MLPRMTHQITEDNVDIYAYPHLDTDTQLPSGTEVAIGDMHANAVKFIYYLAKHLFLDIDPRDYVELVEIYKRHLEFTKLVGTLYDARWEIEFRKRKLASVDCNQAFAEASPAVISTNEKIIEDTEKKINAQLEKIKEDIAAFNRILMNARKRRNDLDSHLIGDHTADRGGGDHLILYVFHALQNKKIKHTHLWSNHSAAFDALFVWNDKGKMLDDTLGFKQARSTYMLNYLLERGVVKKEEIDKLVQEDYLPNLKLLNYRFDDKKVVIYSHAPIDLIVVEAAARVLGVKYRDETPIQLAVTIELINAAFVNRLRNNKLAEIGFINRDYSFMAPDVLEGDMKNNPINVIIWNRNRDILKSPDAKQTLHPNANYAVEFVSGHDTPEVSNGLRRELDNKLGKFEHREREGVYIENNTGTYSVTTCQGRQLTLEQALAIRSFNEFVSKLKSALELPNAGLKKFVNKLRSRDVSKWVDFMRDAGIYSKEEFEQLTPKEQSVATLSDTIQNAIGYLSDGTWTLDQAIQQLKKPIENVALVAQNSQGSHLGIHHSQSDVAKSLKKFLLEYPQTIEAPSPATPGGK